MGFPGGASGKEPSCQWRRPGFSPGSGRSSGGVNGKPTPVFLPGEFHGQRSLVGYSPWGRKSQTRLKSLSLHTHIHRTIFLSKTLNVWVLSTSLANYWNPRRGGLEPSTYSQWVRNRSDNLDLPLALATELPGKSPIISFNFYNNSMRLVLIFTQIFCFRVILDL